MKKILFTFFLLMILCIPIKSNAAIANSSSSIKVYSFYKNDCKDCESEKEWLEKYKKESFIDIEYINIDDNDELYNKIKKEISIKGNKTPLVVIGSNYFKGFNNKIKEEITNAIDNYEKADNYCDIVSKIQNNEDTKECININKDIYIKKNNYTKLIFIILAIVIIVSIGIYILFRRKK